MHVFIATLNYPPEPSGFAPRVAALAQHLAQRGHRVDVFTGFPFAPHWRRYHQYRGQLIATERAGRLTIHRATHFIPRRPSSAWQRIAMEGSFAIVHGAVMIAALLRRGRPDAVIYHGAQPAIAMLVRIVSALAGRPYVVNITDLAAQLGREVGIVGRRLYPVLDAFEFAAYRGAAGANVLSPSFAEALVEHGYTADRIRVARDPIDVESVRPVARDEAFRARYGIDADAFVALHAGSMGRKQGLLNVVAAAARRRGSRLCWVLVGEGEAKEDLVAAVRAQRLEDAVRFVPFQRDEEVARMFAAADALLLNQLHTVKDTVIPSKLLTYMASGRPVVAAVNPGSQAADVLRGAGGGPIVTPEDPDALAAAVERLQALTPDALAALGARNRAYAEEHFDQRKILAEHERFLLSLLPGRGGPRAA
ncbi:MAG: hypothetical protein A3H29_15870 [Acidobacteria bacterium RIFCSPLOWO2_02_FULL_67_21]|nr:MAG: hypothetical protein A3H29_15870 [Acidobacteria bacterium RIFCSPLOWO2_02_FULL_67_21]